MPVSETPSRGKKSPRYSRGVCESGQEKKSGGCAFLFDRLQVLTIFLRVADDFALGEAVDPLVVRQAAAFAAGANAPAVKKVCGTLLGGWRLIKKTGGHVEDADVAVGEKLQWIVNLVHAVELRRTFGMEAFEPGGIDEVGEQNVIDLIADAVVFTGVADLVGVENSGGVGVLNENGEVDVGVAEHFQKFVAGGDSPGRGCLDIAGGEHLAQGQSVASEIVVAEGVGLIGVVEQHKPPASGGRLSAFGDDVEFSVDAPDGTEVIGDLFLERGDDWRHIGVGEHGALIDDRNLDGGGLSVGELRHIGLSWEQIRRTRTVSCVTLW